MAMPVCRTTARCRMPSLYRRRCAGGSSFISTTADVAGGEAERNTRLWEGLRAPSTPLSAAKFIPFSVNKLNAAVNNMAPRDKTSRFTPQFTIHLFQLRARCGAWEAAPVDQNAIGAATCRKRLARTCALAGLRSASGIPIRPSNSNGCCDAALLSRWRCRHTSLSRKSISL
jgi:hypothetical protein